MDAAASAGYYIELTSWAWSAWDACKPAGAKP